MTFVNISSSDLSNNQADIGPFGGGGAIYSSSGVLALSNNILANNAASGYGGAIAYNHQCLPGETLCLSQQPL